ncbi:hypothetical protein BASA83_011546 [Batrachochytrium salamandrivorans]|nr:hypothetical protein BASA83_011546 [Batrachochytrium salamandrivorans]
MFDPLLRVLYYFVIHYAGQTNQGNTNEGDDVDHASDSKDATSSLQRVHSLRIPTALQESNTPDQRSTSAPADLQPGKECQGGHGIRKVFSPCPQQQSQPEPLPSTSYDPHQSNEMPLPIRIKKAKENFYSRSSRTNSTTNLLKRRSAAQCMSSRPPKLMIPYESMIQMYLSRPGRHNPYVPEVIDYIILKDRYITVMEYVGEGWATLSSYINDNGRPDIVDAREIIKEIMNAILFLRQQGVMHEDLHVGNVMYNEQTGKVKLVDLGMSRILSGWEEEKSLQLKLSDSPSTDSKSKAEVDEIPSMRILGKLLYNIITGENPYAKNLDHVKMIRRFILPDSDSYKSKLKENAVQLITDLVSLDPNRTPSFEEVLNHPFFSIKQ